MSIEIIFSGIASLQRMNVTSPLDQLENLTDSLFVNLENKSSFNAAHFSILKEAASKILDLIRQTKA